MERNSKWHIARAAALAALPRAVLTLAVALLGATLEALPDHGPVEQVLAALLLAARQFGSY